MLKISLLIITSTLLSFLPLQAKAQACNFEKSGGTLTGTIYIAKVVLPPKISKNAIAAIREKLESSGQRILSVDVAQGTLQAEQPSKSSSRALPITASVRPMASETEAVVTIRLNPLQSAPDEAVKAELCAYAMAANQNVPETIGNVPALMSQVAVGKSPQEVIDSEFVKNGIPCLSGVCVGDDITKIRGVNWLAQHPVLKKDARQATAGEINLLRSVIKASDNVLGQIATASATQTYDSNAIAALTNVTAACDKLSPLSFQAHFKSENGHVTQVIFQPTANENSTEQQFRIAYIARVYEDAVTDKQKQDLHDALVDKYKSVMKTYNFAYSRQGEYPNALVNISNMRGKLELRLTESSNISISRVDKLKQHPLCGGTKSIQIN